MTRRLGEKAIIQGGQESNGDLTPSLVLETVSHWRNYADEAGVPGALRDQIQGVLRVGGF